MTRLTLNAAAHGQTAGTVVTDTSSGNTASLGSYVDKKELAGNGQVTFEGTDVLRFTDSPGTSNVARLDWTTRLNGTKFSVEVEINAMPAPGGGEMRILEVRNYGNTASVVRVQVVTDGRVRVYNGAGTTLWTSTTTLPTGAGSRVHVGGDVSAATLSVNIYTGSDGKSNTAAESSGTLTSINWGGATNVGGLRFGSITSAADLTWDLRNVRIDDQTSAPLGALSASAPTVGNGVEVIGHNFTGAVTGGTSPYTLAGSQLTGTSVGTISISGLVGYFTRPASGTVSVRWTVTDNVGSTASTDRTYSATAAAGPKVWDGTQWV